MSLIAMWFRWLVLGVFIEAAWAHLVKPSRLESVLRIMAIPHARAVAFAVTVVDLLIVSLFVLGPASGAALAICYLVIVSVGVANTLRAGGRIVDCGCSSKPRPADRGLFLRNALLGFGSALVIAVPQPSIAEPAAWLGTMLFVLYSIVRHWIRHLSRRGAILVEAAA